MVWAKNLEIRALTGLERGEPTSEAMNRIGFD